MQTQSKKRGARYSRRSVWVSRTQSTLSSPALRPPANAPPGRIRGQFHAIAPCSAPCTKPWCPWTWRPGIPAG
jgi:hypothetical protein